MPAKKIAVIIGSLRKESINRKMAKALIKLAPDSLQFEFVEIGQLPLYNQDLDDTQTPAAWTEFRHRIKGYDGILFVTPEYNRSVPGSLKNALDVGSRPAGQNAWNGIPCGVVTVSPGSVGGMGANHHLRQSLVALNMPAMAHPEAYIGNASKIMNPEGEIISEDTTKFLKKFIDAFAKWTITNAKQ